MKKNYFLAFIIFPLVGLSQITIEHTDMPQVGDVISRKADTMTMITGPGNAGANQVWNFTQLSNYIIDEITSVVSPSSTSYGSSFPTANIAMTNDNSSYLFFEQNTTMQNVVGLAGDVLGNGTPITAPMVGGDLIHNFPRTYGSNFSDTYTIDVTVNGSSINPAISQVRFKRVGLAKDSTDAWGQITTPVGTYNSLRVKRTDFTTDSIWVQPVFPPTWSLYQTTKDTAKTFQWLAKGGKLAIAELSLDSIGTPKKFTWSLIAPVSEINEISSNNFFDLSPNPVNNEINLRIDENNGEEATLTISDESGRIIKTENFQIQKAQHKIDCSSLESGVYFIQITSNRNQEVKKFIKQ